MKSENRELELLNHAPVVQDQGLRGTSSWANFWLERDHTAQCRKSRDASNENQAALERFASTGTPPVLPDHHAAETSHSIR